MTKDEAMKQALEAWQTSVYGSESHHKAMLLAMTNMAQALAAPVQEPAPACWQGEDGCPNRQSCCDAQHCLYTTPPAQPAPVQEPVAWLEILRNNKTATDEVIGAFLRGHAEHLTGETFVLTTPPAAPVQEPLTDSFVQLVPDKCDRIVWRGSYHHLPPAAQRQWVGLSQDEFRDFASTFEYGTGGLIRAIEAKLKEKNT